MNNVPMADPSSILMPAAGLFLLAVLSLAPLLCETTPVDFLPPHSSIALAWASKAAVGVLMGLAVLLRARADRAHEPRAVLVTLTLVLVAAVMTGWHWYWLDLVEGVEAWQRDMYWRIFNHVCDAPHQFRMLPYGFTRTLERLTGDWRFACLAYRWFFTFWFVWAAYRFARLYHDPARASITPLVLLALYPLSIAYYLGQLTDPLSHALFALAFIYTVQDRWLLLAATLALGILAKETTVLVVPAYWLASYAVGLLGLLKAAAAGTPLPRLEGKLETLTLVSLLKAGGLGVVCVAAFLAARLPFGWRPGNESMNGLTALMIGTNLGIGEPVAKSSVPQSMNYLHPLLFTLPFLPFIAWQWRRLDVHLKALFVTVPPLLLFSNLCYGWMYESRNYVPLLPLLTTMAVPRRTEVPSP